MASPLTLSPQVHPLCLGSRAKDGHSTKRDLLVQSTSQWKGNEAKLGTTFTQTTINLMKAIIGAGCLALPLAFKNMGPLAAIVTIAVVGCLSAYTTDMLIQVKNEVVRRKAQEGLPVLNESSSLLRGTHVNGSNRGKSPYLDAMEFTFGSQGYMLTYGLLVFTSLGVSASYISFFTQTMNTLYPSLSSWIFASLAGLVVMAMALLNSFKQLSMVSVIGLASLAFGIAATMWYGFQEPQLSLFDVANQRGLESETYLLSFGTISFLFCVHFLVFPVESAMQEPKHFSQAISWSTSVVSALAITFGLLGYMAFGKDVRSIILDNLPKDSWLMLAVRLAICFSLLSAYPLTLAPGRELVESTFGSSLHQGSGVRTAEVCPSAGLSVREKIIRSILVGLTVILSQAKSFGLVTNLVGGLSMSFLGFVAPPLMHLSLFHKELSRPRVFGSAAIALSGLIAVTLTTFVSLRTILS